MGEWLDGLDRARLLSREAVRARVLRYTLARVGPQYDHVFQQVHDLYADGWYTPRSGLTAQEVIQ